MNLILGAMAPPISEQLGVPRDIVEHHEADAKAISRLAVRGIIPVGEARKARARLVKQIKHTLS